MSIVKIFHHRSKKLLNLAVFMGLILFGVILSLQWEPGPSQWLSSGSIHKLHALNAEHEMVIDSLLSEHYYLQADLFQTNSLDVKNIKEEDHQGLLVTLDQDLLEHGFLMLQPSEALSEEELEKIAERYEAVIPEFASVEVDQNVELFGEPHYRVVPDEYVNLTEETELIFTDEEPSEEPEAFVAPLIRVGIIDSGIDLYHEAFDEVNIIKGWNTITDDTVMYDDVGHGTHIAGIVTANNPTVEIIPYKIVDKNGGRLSNVLEAFDKAIADEPNVINASFGLMSPSYSLEVMMNEAYLDGIIVVAAAGNSDSSKGFYPATYDTTLAVASVDGTGEAMEKSNFGNWIDIAANGHQIKSTLPDDKYGYKSGTSQAAALISSRVAEILALEGEWTLEKVIQALQEEKVQVESGKLAGVSIVD